METNFSFRKVFLCGLSYDAVSVSDYGMESGFFICPTTMPVCKACNLKSFIPSLDAKKRNSDY
jgi:hypothetical protein